MSITDRQSALTAEYSQLASWEDRYKKIIATGKRLAAYPEEHRLDQFKVHGCQAQVWLFPEVKEGKVYFHADSDALITKGLIALLMRVYSGATAKEILETPPTFIKDLGLESKLSPNRANGLFSMVKQIKLYATALSMRSY
jgi:cysteine desulfuration protein SufE